MSSIDFRKVDDRKSETAKRCPADSAAIRPVGPVRDLLGISFFVFHLGPCIYIVFGWLAPLASALVFYLTFLPLVAMQ